MDKKYQKNLYYGQRNHKGEGVRHLTESIIYGEDFETLQKFYEHCKNNGYQVHHTPMNVSKSLNLKQY